MIDGYGSKKFWFAVGIVAVAFSYAVLAASSLPALKPMFETFSGILEFVTVAYLTGNVASKWVAGKAGITAKKAASVAKKGVSAPEAGEDPLDVETPRPPAI